MQYTNVYKNRKDTDKHTNILCRCSIPDSLLGNRRVTYAKLFHDRPLLHVATPALQRSACISLQSQEEERVKPPHCLTNV